MLGLRHLARRLTPTDAFEGRLRIELLRGMARQWRAAMLGMPITAAGLAAIDLLWVPFDDVLAWYLALLVAIAIALISNDALIKSEPKAEDVGWWTIRIAGGLMPYFAVFATMVPLFWVEGNTANNIHLTVLMLVSLPIVAVMFGACPPLAFMQIVMFLPLLARYSALHIEGMAWAGPAIDVLSALGNCGVCL